MVAAVVFWNESSSPGQPVMLPVQATQPETWQPPDTATLGNDSLSRLIRYGRDLVAHTAFYYGPAGRLGRHSNGMNCQNCHLGAGTVPYANSFAAVAANYPQLRPRSGIIESIAFRINDCFQRSLDGYPIDTAGRELKAMEAWIAWVGQGVPKGKKPPGAGVTELPLLPEAADPSRGKQVYTAQCARCHGANGNGQLAFDKTEYLYPPLWGDHSYNVSAGLYRLSKFAAYVKANMPYGIATASSPVLTDKEAWDVAAFVNSMPRPAKRFPEDWPDISRKSFDYPFGPYADHFTERQHKYGPFTAMIKSRK